MKGGVDLRARAWYNPELASQVYNVPGVIGLLLLLMALLTDSPGGGAGAGAGNAGAAHGEPHQSPRSSYWEDDSGGHRLHGGPGPHHDCGDPVVQGSSAGVPGRPWLLASFVYVLAGLAFGLLISTISRTQQEAFLTMFLFLLPGIILSGFMYPIDTMPAVFQHLTLLNPVRYFMEMVRAIFLKGQGFRELWVHFLVLTVMALGALVAAGLRFRKSLD